VFVGIVNLFTGNKKMNKRNKNKAIKEKFFYYRGEMIWKNSAYTPKEFGRKKYRFHLFYNEEGNDCYFKTLGNARSYIDKNFSAYEKKRALPFFPDMELEDDKSFSYEMSEADKIEIDAEFNREVFVW
jgi:hypothetical protein